MILTWCGALDSITDAKRAYLLLEEYFPTACAIYAHKTVLTQRELSFAGNCHDTLHRATVLPEKYRLILKPLQGRDEKTAIDTLSAYLIDADKNIAAAAKYLHVHESAGSPWNRMLLAMLLSTSQLRPVMSVHHW